MWVHRKRCPKCRHTYTLIPQFVHVLKTYDNETIVNVLEHKIQTKKFGFSDLVSPKLQRIWFKQFITRCKIRSNFENLVDILKSSSSIIAAPMNLKILQSRNQVRRFLEGTSKAYHRLGFVKSDAFT